MDNKMDNVMENKAADTQRQTVTLNINVKKYIPQLVFVLNARTKEKGREILTWLYVDSYGYHCTDGRRLHSCLDTSLVPGLCHGLYEVIINAGSVIFIPKEGMFPDYKAIIPKYSDNEITIDLDSSGKVDNQKISIALAKITLKLNKSTLNYDYLKDAAGFLWTVFTMDHDKPILMKSGKLMVVIMPLIIK